MKRLASIALALGALAVLGALALRLGTTLHAGRELARAAARATAAGLTPGLADSAAPAAERSFAAAAALVPGDRLLLPWLPSGVAAVPPERVAELERTLDLHRAALALAEAGAAPGYRPVFDRPAPESGSVVARNLAALLRGQAIARLLVDRPDEALRSAVAGLVLCGRDGGSGEPARLAGRLQDLAALANRASLVVSEGEPSAEACRSALAALADVSAWAGLRRFVALRARADVAEAFEAPRSAALSLAPGRQGPVDRLAAWFRAPWVALDEARYLEHMTAVARWLEDLEGRVEAGQAWAPELAAACRRVHAGAALEGLPAAAAALDLARLRVAARLYRLERGAWPAALADLPLTPGRGTVDPWTGTGYVLLSRAPGEPLVYGRGPDGTDDGGSPARDAVWPEPAASGAR